MSAEYRGLCPHCGKDEIYSEVLTDGLCLTCYTRNQEEMRLADIEAELDYESYC